MLGTVLVSVSALPGDQGAVRQKRGGWGYENVYVNHVAAPVTTPIVTPGVSRAVYAAPVSLAPANYQYVPQQYVVQSVPTYSHIAPPPRTVIATAPVVVPQTYSYSYVAQHGPSYSYQLQQRHPNYYYPATHGW